MKKRFLLAFTGILLAGLSWAGCKASRAGYEGPAYAVISKKGDVEIRRYETMTSASTSMAAQKEGSRNSGFGRLFKYITGENEKDEKIAMTSPVFVDTDSDANETSMRFLMPKATIQAGVPDPSSPSVTVKKVPGGDFAVLRFKGHKSRDAQREALAALRKSITTMGLSAVGDPVFAYYDPPWIPEFLRRNEVLLRVNGVKN